jgi:hypothetical protein
MAADTVTCITSAQCSSGQVCCGAGGSATGALGTACLTVCPSNQRITCNINTPTDCPADSGLTQCTGGGSAGGTGNTLYDTCRVAAAPVDAGDAATSDAAGGGDGASSEAAASDSGGDATVTDAAGGDAADASGQ